MSVETIAKQALKLSADDRALLAEQLMQSLMPSSPHEDAWTKEANARHEAFIAGHIEAIDGEEFVASLRAKLRGA